MSQRRAPQKRRKQKSMLPVVAIIITLVALIAIGAAVYFSLKGRTQKPANAAQTAVPTVIPEQTGVEAEGETEQAATIVSPLSELLDNEDASALPTDVFVEVEDLSLNTSLPAEWKNFLLLGTDDRNTEAGARTDAMIICSININTGEVRLSSLLRDLAVNFDLPREETIYRINAAYAFGGAKLAMKTVNELFELNIEDYVLVNFFGFQEMAYRLGGVDIDITEAEMHSINHNVIEQARIARRIGVDDSDMPLEELKSYGPNTHLDGRQALAYARIRKLDSDISRSERQRVVLKALAGKLKGREINELVALAASLMPYVETSLTLEEILGIGSAVLGRELDIQETYLPIRGTYVPETRNGESMLYDCNFPENAAYLHRFIYGK